MAEPLKKASEEWAIVDVLGQTSTSSGTQTTNAQLFYYYSPDKTEDLLDLIRQWCDKAIDRAAFRKRFVMEFTSTIWGEPLDSILMAIAAEFSEEFQEEQILEDRVFVIAGIVEAMRMNRTPETRRFFKLTQSNASNIPHN